MATDYIVSSTDLDNIADAINAKIHSSTQLEFPDDFVDAIESIDGVQTIVFYVQISNNKFGKESFIAEKNMTWNDFINSKYNPYYTSSSKRFYAGPGDPMGNYKARIYYVNTSNYIANALIKGGNSDAVIVDGQTYT